MFPTPEQIEGYIKQGIVCTHIQVEGDGSIKEWYITHKHTIWHIKHKKREI